MKNVSPVKWDIVLEEMLINDKSRHSVAEAGYRMFSRSKARAGLHSLLIAVLIILEPLLSEGQVPG